MMFNTKTGGYSEAIATVIEGMVILNWNQKNMGELVSTINDDNMIMDGCKLSPIATFIKWFKRQDEINSKLIERDIGVGSLSMTMRGLER